MRITGNRRLPNLLRKYRKGRGLKQKQVAQILGLVSASMISRWEKGISLPNTVNVLKLAAIEGKPVLDILGKGKKPRLVSCPVTLAQRLMGYVYKKGLNPQHRIFSFNQTRGWQIIKAAAASAGFKKRIFPHLLRHSDAIERLRQTGNPKALEHHLGHSSISMTMRYLSTLTQEDSLRIQQKVEFKEKDEY